MSFVVKSLLSSGKTLRTPHELIEAGLVPLEQRENLNRVAQRYAIAIPPDFLALIEHPDDPIAKQVVPSVQELTITQAERSDPIGDETFSPVQGIVHRYADRALLKPLLLLATKMKMFVFTTSTKINLLMLSKHLCLNK